MNTQINFRFLNFLFLFLFSFFFFEEANANEKLDSEEIISRLHGLHELAQNEKCLSGENPKKLEKKFQKKGLTESCWRILLEIESYESQLSSLQVDLESRLQCEGGNCAEVADTMSDENLQDIKSVQDELSCNEIKKKEISQNCSADVGCVFMSSALFGAGYIVEKFIDQDKLPKNCSLGNDACITQLATSFIKSIFTFFEGSWELLKGAGRLASTGAKNFWDWVTGAEDHSSTSQLSLAEASEDEGFFDMLLNDFTGTMMKIFSGLVSGLKEWLKTSVFCQKWSGVPHLSECKVPTNDFDCLPCKQMLTGMCSITGALVSEVLPAFLTGGLVTAAKYGASAASKIAKSLQVSKSTLDVIKNSRVAQLVSKTATHLDDTLKISRGAKYTKEAIQKTLAAIKAYTLSPLRNLSKSTLATLKELSKKGEVFLAETKTGKVLLFSKNAAEKFAKTTGTIIIYPVENPMTAWAFKQGEKSFEKVLTLGASKTYGAAKVADVVATEAVNVQPVIKVSHKSVSNRKKLVKKSLSSKNPNLDQIISDYYPELKSSELALELGEDAVKASESELRRAITNLPNGNKKKKLLSELKTTDFLLEMKSIPFAQDYYSKHVFESLSKKRLGSTISGVTNKTEQEILDSWRTFEFKGRNSEVAVELKTELFSGSAHGSDGKTLSVVSTMVEKGKSEPLGYFVISYPKRENGIVRPYLEIIKTKPGSQPVKGITSDLIPFMKKKIEEMGLKTFDLEADWAGRTVWAKFGFTFDKDFRFIRNGEKLSQVELARENLTRFLDHHQLKLEDLLLKTDPKSPGVPITSLDQLNEPIDFVSMVHKDGQKVKVKKYVDQGKYEPESEEDIGTAFCLGGTLKRSNQTIEIIGIDDLRVSDIYLPNWMGVLESK